MDLLKAMDKMQLYVTGTVMSNRIPAPLRIKKNSKEFKSMNRGDFKNHVYKYNMEDGTEKNYGLVAWKDSDTVYCLSSAHNNISTETCKRKGQGTILTLTRPSVIGNYNKYMGGVDLADMRRLHCNSTIMGQHRWWLKLFFYLLDVGTGNGLVLYREAMNNDATRQLSLVEFKKQIVHNIIGDTIQKTIKSKEENIHKLQKYEGDTDRRYTCVYCALASKKCKTRFICNHTDCQMPFCNPKYGDCHAVAHSKKEIYELCLRKWDGMQKNTNNRGK